MFDFEIGSDLELIVETARHFAQHELHPVLREHETKRKIALKIRATFAEMGFAGLELSEELGGAGLGTLARTLVTEDLAAGDAGAAVAVDPLGPALYALEEFGGESALREFAVPLLQKEGARAVLISESNGLLSIGDEVSGTIPWVPADHADLIVIATGDEALVIREGFSMNTLRGSGLRAAGAAEIELDQAPIAARWKNAQAAERSLARAQLYTASLQLGIMRQASESAQAYALEREAFGKPIAHHQGLTFLLMDMRAAVDGARLLVQEAAWRQDAALPAAAASASAYVETIEAGLLVGPSGVQVLGGHGFMQDYPLEKCMRECRSLSLLWGGIDAARERAGREVCMRGVPYPLSEWEESA
ncbi:MAG: acyl-CoA dehydrogenase family protein [Myxococcota bacterium]|nr:acyl-CoA dehydrogenase family protein [Myxococcota bacterium]